MRRTEILRAPRQNLFTFGTTNITYHLVTEAAYSELVGGPTETVIREGKIHQVYSLMQAGQKFGMQTMNQSLVALYNRKEIAYEDAIARSPDPKEFEGMLGRAMMMAG